MADEVYDDWHFPKSGIDMSAAFGRQPNRAIPATGEYWRTTRVAKNVRAYDVDTTRLRGATRCGLSKLFPNTVAPVPWIVQELLVFATAADWNVVPVVNTTAPPVMPTVGAGRIAAGTLSGASSGVVSLDLNTAAAGGLSGTWVGIEKATFTGTPVFAFVSPVIPAGPWSLFLTIAGTVITIKLTAPNVSDNLPTYAKTGKLPPFSLTYQITDDVGTATGTIAVSAFGT